MEMENKGVVEGMPKMEELLKENKQLRDALSEAYSMMQTLETNVIMDKISILFKVIENKQEFKEEFVSKCVEQIEGILTPSDKGDAEVSKEEGK